MVMAIELPEKVAELTKDLGQPIARFSSSAVQSALYLVSGLLAIGLGVGIFVFLFLELVNFPDKGIQRPIGTVVAGFALLSAGAGILVRRYRLKSVGVVVFDSGIARLHAGRCEIMRWEDIRAVRRGTPPGKEQFHITTPSRLSLVDKEDREWVFTETLSGMKNLRTLVEERTLPFMVLTALDELKGGRTLSFGDLGLMQDGLIYPLRGLLTWEYFAGAGLTQGTVVVLSKLLTEPYCHQPIYCVPNSHLLFALTERLRPGQQ
jgi:hypothetical protein